MKIKRKKPVYQAKPIDDKKTSRGLDELFAKQKKDTIQQVPQPTQQPQQPQQVQQPQQQFQQQPQKRMNIPNPFGGGTGDKMYNPPNPMGISGGNVPNPMGGKVNVAGRENQGMKFNAPNEWGVKPLNMQRNQPQQQQQQFQQPQQPQQPQQQFQQSRLENFGQPVQQPQQQEPEEEEPYWSAEEWETWAYQLAVNHPEAQQLLPEWFMQALQEE